MEKEQAVVVSDWLRTRLQLVRSFYKNTSIEMTAMAEPMECESPGTYSNVFGVTGSQYFPEDMGEPPAKRARFDATFEAAVGGPQGASPDPKTFAHPSAIGGNNLASLQSGVRNLLGPISRNPSLPVGKLPAPVRVDQGTQTTVNNRTTVIIMRRPILPVKSGYMELRISSLEKDEPFFHVRLDTSDALVDASRAHRDTPHAFPIISFREYTWWMAHNAEIMTKFPELIGIRLKAAPAGTREAVYGDGNRKPLDVNVRSSYSRPFFDVYRFSGIILADLMPDHRGPFPAYTGALSGAVQVKNIWSPNLKADMRIGFEEILDLRNCLRTYSTVAGVPGVVASGLVALAIVDGTCFELLCAEYRHYLLGDARTAARPAAIKTKLEEIRIATLTAPIHDWFQTDVEGILFDDNAVGTLSAAAYIERELKLLRTRQRDVQAYHRALRTSTNEDVVKIRQDLATDILTRGQERANVFPTNIDIETMEDRIQQAKMRSVVFGSDNPGTAIHQEVADFFENGPRRMCISNPYGSGFGNDRNVIYGRRQFIGTVLTIQPGHMLDYTNQGNIRQSSGPSYQSGMLTPYPSRVNLDLNPTEPMTDEERYGF